MNTDRLIQTRAYRALRLWVLDRDRHLCRVGGPTCTRVATEVDHVIARADGGAVFDPDNMRAACSACNAWRAVMRTNARRYRYHVTDDRYPVRM